MTELKSRTLHMIGNSHIDPVWLWRRGEGIAEIRATFRSALDRMNEYPDFRFTADSAFFYAVVEEIDPEMFEEIRARVAEGRWEIAGGWWVEPDCNLASGESYVRQGLVGQSYFASRFGRIATVGYNVDPFGHAATLPALLAGAGLTCYVFMRPGPHEMALPGGPFWWQAPDGSRVLTVRLPNEYCSPMDEIENHVNKSIAQLDPGWTEGLCFFGVGNHGGGPTRANIENIALLDAADTFPTLAMSTPERYFGAVRASAGVAAFPVVRGELQHHAVGAYAAHSGVKRWNRRAENELGTAERLAALAERFAGARFPRGELERAWRDVLFNQFHDILAGTAMESAYEDARDEYGEACAIATRTRDSGLQAIARRIDIATEDRSLPVVVFNPHAWPAHLPVEVEHFRAPEGRHLVDETGASVPFSLVRSEVSVRSRHRAAFLADLPPMGYRVYRLSAGQDERARPDEPVRARETGGRIVVETGGLRLDVDATTGAIALLAVGGVAVIDGPSARAVVLEDPTDTWSHRSLRYVDEAGAFDTTRVRLLESGPVRAVVRIESAFGRSTLMEDLVVWAGREVVEIRAELDWHEHARLLKYRFATALDGVVATHEIPYGHIERPTDGAEQPSGSWVDVTGRPRVGGGLPASEDVFGLSVLNDGKSSVDVLGARIGLTILRSPAYAHHDPVPLPDADARWTDQGLSGFAVALLPHAGTWREAGTVRRAAELNAGPVALMESFHRGPLPPAASFAAVDAPSVVIGALKSADDGSGDLVVRAIETWGIAAEARIDVGDRSFVGSLGANEIRTWRVPKDPAAPIVSCDLLERPLGVVAGLPA